MAAPSQRRGLGALFLFIGAAMAGIAWTAYKAEQWVIVVAAAVLAVWMGTLVVRAWRPR